MSDVTMKMPDLSTVSETVKVLRWLVESGQSVKRGENLLEVETDKSVMIVESTVTGILKTTVAEPGEEVPAGVEIAIFEVAGDAGSESVKVARKSEESAARPVPPPIATTPPVGRTGGSFFAKNRQGNRPGTGGESSGGGDDA